MSNTLPGHRTLYQYAVFAQLLLDKFPHGGVYIESLCLKRQRIDLLLRSQIENNKEVYFFVSFQKEIKIHVNIYVQSAACDFFMTSAKCWIYGEKGGKYFLQKNKLFSTPILPPMYLYTRSVAIHLRSK